MKNSFPLIILIPVPYILYYLQYDQRLHNFIKYNNYKQYAPTYFDI